MTPTHTNKSGRIFRYYVSHRLIKGKDPAAYRFPAQQLEKLVDRIIHSHLRKAIQNLTPAHNANIETINNWQQHLTRWLNQTKHTRQISPTSALIHKGVISKDNIQLELEAGNIAQIMGCSADQINDEILTVNSPFTLRRRGVEAKLITGNTPHKADSTLQRALATSHLWLENITHGKNINQIAREEDVCDAFIRRRLSLAMLSPEIQKAIMNGTQPVELTLEKIVRTTLPIDWSEQHQLLGFE